MFRIVEHPDEAAPIGAFGAMAFTIGKYGIGSLANLAKLVGDLLSDLRCCSSSSCSARSRGCTASRSSS